MNPDEQVTAVLLCLGQLPEIGPSRLAWCASGDVVAVWAAVVAGRVLEAAWSNPELALRWRDAASRLDPISELARHVEAGVDVSILGATTYPERLAADPRPPIMLCSRGESPAARLPMVGIVGTRRATAYGVSVARELGAHLAEAGVGVVSGLALGIDAAAQSAALAAGGSVTAVVASGLDRVYPRRNHELWDAIGRAGWLVTEVPLGVEPQRWRFPVRNRIIAGLCDVLVVVESNHAGGSMHTVREAEQRGITVMAVPGSIRSPTSAGTNQLISEGCPPCCGIDDVLVALGLSTEGASSRGGVPSTDLSLIPPGLADEAARVLSALGWEQSSIDQVATRADLGVGEVAAVLIELSLSGLVVETGGLWERTS